MKRRNKKTMKTANTSVVSASDLLYMKNCTGLPKDDDDNNHVFIDENTKNKAIARKKKILEMERLKRIKKKELSDFEKEKLLKKDNILKDANEKKN